MSGLTERMDAEARLRRAFRRLPRIETARLTLRPIMRGDARDLFGYAADPEVARHVLWSPHRSLADSRLFISAARRQYRHGWPGSFAIVLRETGRMIGTIGFMWVNPEHRSAEVGYSLARAQWNKGLMTEALEAVVAFGFETLGLNRLEAQHELTNPASGRVMEKCGFSPEGVLRQRLYNKDHYADVRLYAILREDTARQGG